jgi:deoxyribonuclease-4
MSNFKKYYGTHLSKSKGIISMLDTVVNNGIKTCQFFTKSPQTVSKIKELDIVEKEHIENYINKHNLNIFIHGQYILNLCRDDLSYAIDSIMDDMNYISNIKGVVIHMGKDTKNLGKENSFLNMKNNILTILSYISGTNKYLILETSVKTKTDVNEFYKIEGLAKLYNELGRHPNVKFCIDTCHIYSSGYNISTKDGFNEYMKVFHKLIGIKNIILFHLNDSKVACNKCLDRHEELGKGYIFKDNNDTLKYIIDYCTKNKICFVTETNQDLIPEMEFLEKVMS